MRRQQDRVLAGDWIGATQNAHDVPSFRSWHLGKAGQEADDAGGQRIGERRLLQEAAMIAPRLQSKTREQRGGIERGQMFVTGAAAASVEFIGSKEAHIPLNAGDAESCTGRFRDLAMAGGHTQQDPAKDRSG